MSKISLIGSSWAEVVNGLAVGTKAIVQCGDCLCLGVKHPDGFWRDRYGGVLKVDRLERVIGPEEAAESWDLRNGAKR
jgi:hypothetical protein